MIRLIDEAVRSGARQRVVCERFDIPPRTVQRWRTSIEDRRGLREWSPPNRLSEDERKRILAVVNSMEFRDRSPKQVVPTLADRGIYLASESTVYRILRAEGQLTHRAASRPPTPRTLRTHLATRPNQLWSWDITWLPSTLRGSFFYLYMVVDVWSRKVVGWTVHEREGHDLAAELIAQTCREEQVNAAGLVLHSDNGGPMKGATMLATLRRLGILPSFSRPGVSDDNPYSEALFRTLKYRPCYPSKPFATVDTARTWVATFVRWYNTEHLHSAIRFVTPSARHQGEDLVQLADRERVYRRARQRHPQRWSGATRNWAHIATVRLHPEAAQPPHTGSLSRSEEGVKELLVGEESRRHAARGRRSLRPDEQRLSA